MRGYYQFTSSDVGAVFQHLLSLDHVTLEDRESIQQAISIFELGFDFADALHHTSYKDCIYMLLLMIRNLLAVPNEWD